jgi:thiol-disulfide isomerase/thioredoxin
MFSKRIAQTILLMVLGMCLIGLMPGCKNRNAAERESTPVHSGPPSSAVPMPPLNVAGEMDWVLIDGTRKKFADYHGKVLVLDFYATWCEPCRKSIPHLMTLQNDYGEKGLQIIGLNVGGPDDRIKVADFARELDIQYPLGFPDKALTDLFLSDDQTIPQTFVFGREGQLVRRFVGYQESTGIELEKVIESQTAMK